MASEPQAVADTPGSVLSLAFISSYNESDQLDAVVAHDPFSPSIHYRYAF